MPDPRVVNLRDFRVVMSGTNRLRLPLDVIRVDRRTKWGNPYVIGEEAWFTSAPDHRVPIDRAMSITMFRLFMTEKLKTEPEFLDPLRGKRLACWCAPESCHAEVILELLDAREAVSA